MCGAYPLSIKHLISTECVQLARWNALLYFFLFNIMFLRTCNNFIDLKFIPSHFLFANLDTID